MRGEKKETALSKDLFAERLNLTLLARDFIAVSKETITPLSQDINLFSLRFFILQAAH